MSASPYQKNSIHQLFVASVIANALVGLFDLGVTAFLIVSGMPFGESFIASHTFIAHATSFLPRAGSASRARTIFYFASHGVIKLALAGVLLRGRLWAYPVALVFFFGFSIYQIMVLLHQWSIFDFVLFILNGIVLVTVALEYRRITRTTNGLRADSSDR